MRSFTIMAVFTLIIGHAGCSPDDKRCGSTVGCDDDDSGMDAGSGGEACQLGEAGCANFGEPSMDGSCTDPDVPQACGGWCWPSGTNCSLPWNSCNGASFRCFAGDQRSNCCEGEVYLCPSDKPYYCPASGECEAHACVTESGQCTYRGADCGSY